MSVGRRAFRLQSCHESRLNRVCHVAGNWVWLDEPGLPLFDSRTWAIQDGSLPPPRGSKQNNLRLMIAVWERSGTRDAVLVCACDRIGRIILRKVCYLQTTRDFTRTWT
jgi:hypothetical protein